VREYLESIGGSARSLLRDVTNEEDRVEAAEGDAGAGDDDGGDDGDVAASSKRGKVGGGQKKKRAPAAASSTAAGAGAPAAAASCPTCFSPLTVDLAAPPASLAPSVVSGSSLPARGTGEVGRGGCGQGLAFLGVCARSLCLVQLPSARAF